MSTNTLNSGSLQGLQMGQTLLVSARKVAGQKVQLEFAEVIEKSSGSVNLLSILNASDPRFSQGGARRAWITAEIVDIHKTFGIDVSDNADWVTDAMGREILPLNILNPEATIGDTAKRVRVQIYETTEPTDWQLANPESAKRRGKDGDFCYHNGKKIYANTMVVLDKAVHVFLEMDKVTVTSNVEGEIYN
jgi:hypothetical protein